jgi:hypothetical protein
MKTVSTHIFPNAFDVTGGEWTTTDRPMDMDCVKETVPGERRASNAWEVRGVIGGENTLQT